MPDLSMLKDFSEEVVLGQFILDTHPTGSNYTCDPPVTDTDIDWLVLIETGSFEDFRELLRYGYNWQEGGSHLANSEHIETFMSYRKGTLNLIVMEDVEFYKAYVAATEEAKRLNLLDKEDRVALFNKHTEKFLTSHRKLKPDKQQLLFVQPFDEFE